MGLTYQGFFIDTNHLHYQVIRAKISKSEVTSLHFVAIAVTKRFTVNPKVRQTCWVKAGCT